jgi:hypothetical protein
MSQRWNLKNNDQWNNFVQYRANMLLAGKAPVVEFIDPKRSIDQNSLIYALYGQIASQNESEAIIDIRRHCKLHYGVPLLRANDEAFCQFYDKSIKGMEYETKLLLMDYMDITSRKEFKKPMATQYIDTIIREYSKQGYSLIHPSEAAP